MQESSLKFHQKYGKNILYIIMFGVLSFVLLYFVVFDESCKAPTAFLIIALLIGAASIYMSIITFDKRPLVEINAKGLNVLHHQPSFVKWEDINELFIKNYNADVFICLNLKNKNLLMNQNFWHKISTAINRKTGFGEINIWTNLLKVNCDDLFEVLTTLKNENDYKERKNIINNYT